jgi:predicted phage terminase large subunit-like protein
VLRSRMDYPDLKRAVRELAERFHPANILIEDKASGTQLIQELMRDNVYSVTPYEPTMEKVIRLHSITIPIRNGFVYLPTESDWLAAYMHELTTFPNGKHDDQADSTSQALHWLIQQTPMYAVLDCYKQKALAEKLGLPTGYEFTQWDEGEEILARNNKTGHEIRWTGQIWVDARSNAPLGQSETCPSCGAGGAVTLRHSNQKRCQQCGKQWPPISRVQPLLTRRDVLSGTEF